MQTLIKGSKEKDVDIWANRFVEHQAVIKEIEKALFKQN